MDTIKISEIKTGDIMLETAFSLLSEVIHLFQELDEFETEQSIRDKGYLSNHAGVFNWRDSDNSKILYIAEAVAKGICNDDFEKTYVHNNTYKQLLCLRPKFDVCKEDANVFLNRFINDSTKSLWWNTWHGNTHYAFLNLACFAAYYASNKKIWLGTSDENIKDFCCGHFAAFFINSAKLDFTITNPKNIFLHPPKTSPVDLYMSDFFEKYIIDRT